MSGTEHPDAPPPEVPEEFADTYRDAYRRALESDDPYLAPPELPPHEVVVVGTHRRSDDTVTVIPATGGWGSAPWLRPALIGAAALALVVAAYLVGRALSDDEPDTAKPSAAHTTSAGATGSPSAKPSDAEPSTSPGSWDGPVAAVSVDAISADCTAPASNDSSGKRITYVPKNATDGKTDTAWRCLGSAVGQKLTLRLAADADIAEVGLIPGYAKTDPESGADRYAENNRITKVRWTLGDGTSFVQRFDPDPSSRDLQALRIPPTTTDTVTLEILAVRHGPRDTTAISEISLAETS